MRLERVTITGIDDGVDLKWLDEMTAKYQMVEWGILLSDTRKGSPRYPSDQWLADLTNEFSPYNEQFSAHLCGSLSDRLIEDAGNAYERGQLVPFSSPRFFSRIQLNSFPDNRRWDYVHINGLAASLDHIAEIIVPITSDEVLERIRHYTFHQNVNFLRDPSRGQGIPTENWLDPHTEHFAGFAGGIGPDNIRDVIEKFSDRGDDRWYWLDMETNVRTDNVLDPAKVEEVLRIATEFMQDYV